MVGTRHDFCKEGSVNNCIVVEIGGKGDNISVDEMCVNGGRTRGWSEVSSKDARGGIDGCPVELCDLGSNGTAPCFGRSRVILLILIKGLKELAHRIVTVHEAVVGAIGGTAGDNC